MRVSKLQSKIKKLGFTLIELLIIIAIIGILALGILSVINPRAQKQKAKEGTAKANLAKICQALTSCMTSLTSYDAGRCDSWADIGVLQPSQPAGATYSIGSSGGTAASGYVGASVTLTEGSCMFRCQVNNNFSGYAWGGSNYKPGEVYKHTGNCLTE